VIASSFHLRYLQSIDLGRKLMKLMKVSILPASTFFAIASVYGLVLTQAMPAQAVDCENLGQSLGVGLEADSCQPKFKIGVNVTSPAREKYRANLANEKYKLSLAEQLPGAIASYNQTVTATIAHRSLKTTQAVAQGSIKSLPVIELSLVPTTTSLAQTSEAAQVALKPSVQP
jgi:hypothetical protein